MEIVSISVIWYFFMTLIIVNIAEEWEMFPHKRQTDFNP